MEFLHIILASLLSLTVLFLLTKIIGKRQVSQLSLFDYINGITIGSIAAEMAFDPDTEMWRHLTAMVIYTFAGVLFSKISEQSIKTREFIEGKPSVIFKGSEFDTAELRKNHLDISEVFAECRSQGYFDFSKIDLIIAEHNGKISILPKSSDRPLTPNDMSLYPEQEKLSYIVVYEGEMMTGNLVKTGHNKQWLMKKADEQHVSLDEIFIATTSHQGELNVFRYSDRAEAEKISRDGNI